MATILATPATLPLENLRRRPGRTAALLACATVLAATLFGGTLLATNLANGMDGMERRLGADLMVVPQNTETQAEALLTDGTPGTFYLTDDVADRVARADGVAQATEQTYIASLAAACCAEKLQIIGYDPATDFVIQPWVASQHDGTLADGQMIAGANVAVSDASTIELYGRDWPVAAQLAATGTSLDNSVFINRNTVPDMVAASAAASRRAMPDEYAGKAVSAVLIKAADGTDPHDIAQRIKDGDPDLATLGYVYPGGITATTRAALDALATNIAILAAALWAMACAVLAATFATSANERKREFATLRIIGATRRTLLGIIARESALVGLAGGAAGTAAAALAILPFSALIGQRLQLPYLQAGPAATIGLAAASTGLTVLAGTLAALATTWRLARPEAHITLREGE